jgi:hypothetical protein
MKIQQKGLYDDMDSESIGLDRWCWHFRENTSGRAVKRYPETLNRPKNTRCLKFLLYSGRILPASGPAFENGHNNNRRDYRLANS